MKMEEDETFVINGPEPYEPLSQESLGKVLYDSLSRDNSESVAMVDASSGKTLSYQNILERTCSLAKALRKYGSGPCSIHAICSENNLEYFIPVISCMYVGCTVVPINPLYKREELKRCLELTKPNIVFCSQAVQEKLMEFVGTYMERLIIIDAPFAHPGTETMERFIATQLLGNSVSPHEFEPFNECDPSHVAFIMSSSGTTGLPKGVMLTQRNILVRIAQTRDPQLGLSSKHAVGLGLMPFFHVYGLNLGITSVVNGEKLIIMKRFEENAFLSTIEKYRITSISLAPPLAIFLAKTPLLSKYNVSSINDIICGGAPLRRDIEMALTKRLNIKMIKQMYGLTETTLGVTLTRSDAYKPGFCGKVITFMSLKVVDRKSGKSLGPNEVGEIFIKGPMVTKGYFKNEHATREIFTADGWLRSGDLGYYEEDENFIIVDRLKELIKYKGYQVAPAELEAILINHAKVLDVAVVGLPDELAGEVPLAFVVKRDELVTEKELQDYVAEKVSPQKWLRGGVLFVSSIPKNPSGKILRRELRNNLLKGYIQQ